MPADTELPGVPESWLSTWVRAVRVHQWAKNLLLVLPALAAHLVPDTRAIGLLVTAFVSFSLLASAVYLLNDIQDLEHDRAHPVKRTRPLAAGRSGSVPRVPRSHCWRRPRSRSRGRCPDSSCRYGPATWFSRRFTRSG